jgi:hypothetical protein
MHALMSSYELPDLIAASGEGRQVVRYQFLMSKFTFLRFVHPPGQFGLHWRNVFFISKATGEFFAFCIEAEA